MAARRASLAVVAVALLGAAALLALGGRSGGEKVAAGPARPVRDDAELLRGEIDGKLREVAAGLHARASTLAELPRLRAAVSTDAATVHDLTQEELAFRPAPGERIEIAQVKKAGGIESLFRSADGPGPAPPLDRNGFHLLVAGDAVHLAEVVEVPPRERADELRGALALAWRVDLAPVVARAAALGLASWVEVGGARVELHRRPEATGEIVMLPLQSEPGRGAALGVRLLPVIAAPASQGTRPVGAAVLALAGLIAGGLLLRRPSPTPAPPQPAPTLSAPQPAASPTPIASAVSPVAATGVAPASDPAASAPGVNPVQPAARSAAQAAFAATAVQDLEAAAAGTAAARGGTLPMIGRYAILRRLGSGGMADVYLARSTGEAGFEKLVALKVLHADMARQPMIVDHFLDEARLASRLVHPNIVQISDLGRADDDYFIAMEYVEGSDLERLLARARQEGRSVPLKVAFTIVCRLLDGLHAAHTGTGADGNPLELVHRDVKSANVFIARNGAVKIGDFGIAKANQQVRVARTEVGQVKGTAAYMAPEHRIGHAVDLRADLYSAAAIAYEVFTGQEINLDLVKLAHLGRTGWPHLAPMATLRPDLPAELEAAIFKALSYEKEDRHPSCEALAEELEAIAARHGLSAGDKAVAQWIGAEMGSQPAVLPHPGAGTGT